MFAYALAGGGGTVGGVDVLDTDERIDAWLRGLDERTLRQVISLANAVAQERAVDDADIDALTEHGFTEGFTAAGVARDPWIRSGLLVCAGSRQDRSGTSHDCTFVAVGDSWVWECGDLVNDEVRRIAGPRQSLRTVSIVAPVEGMELDVVVSRMRQGMHQMREVRSYVIRGGALELVTTRARKPDGHR